MQWHKEMGQNYNDLQNTTQKTNEWTIRIPCTENRCSGKVSSSCSTSDTRRVIIKRHDDHM